MILRYGIIGLVLSFLALSSLFTVDEREKALVTFLGQFEVDASGQPKVVGSGLHFAWPFFNRVYFLNQQLQTLDISQSPMVTQDQKNVVVDYYIKWRIRERGYADYFKSTGGGSLARAEGLITRIAGDQVRAALGSHDMSAVLKDERSSMMANIQKLADDKARSLGIQIVDVRIKRIDLPKEVIGTVFRQIRTQREQAAMEYRSKGKLTAEGIRAEADRKSTVILAQAQKNSRTVKGEADAAATHIYAEAYAKDPDFYMFYQRMQAYQATFSDPNHVLILKPEGEFFKNFMSSAESNTKR